MFEITIDLIGPSGLRTKTVKTTSFGLWVNRYPGGHQLQGEVRDIRLVVLEEGVEVAYTFSSFKVKEAPT